MPKFIVNKLVRDKLVDEFERMHQKATYRPMSRADHIHALTQKIIEEANEVAATQSKSDLISEIADLQQALNDLKVLSDVTDVQVESAQQAKLDKKGGFLGGSFLESIEILADDPWLVYYRDNRGLFTEIVDE